MKASCVQILDFRTCEALLVTNNHCLFFCSMPSLIEMPRPDYTPPMDRLAHRIARGPGGLLSSMYSSSSDTSEEGGSRGTGEGYEPSVPLRPRILSDSSSSGTDDQVMPPSVPMTSSPVVPRVVLSTADSLSDLRDVVSAAAADPLEELQSDLRADDLHASTDSETSSDDNNQH